MRHLVVFLALTLAACDPADDYQRDQAREREQRERIAQETADQQAAGDLMALGLGAGGEGAGAPAAALNPESCASLRDAEAYVRCLYLGVASGRIDTRREEDTAQVFTDDMAASLVQARAQAPAYRETEMLCICRTPGQIRLVSVTVTPQGEDAASVQTELTGSENPRPILELVRIDEAWRVANIRHPGNLG